MYNPRQSRDDHSTVSAANLGLLLWGLAGWLGFGLESGFFVRPPWLVWPSRLIWDFISSACTSLLQAFQISTPSNARVDILRVLPQKFIYRATIVYQRS